MRNLLTFLIFAASVAPGVLLGQDEDVWSWSKPQNLVFLPPFCTVKANNGPKAEITKWDKILGGNIFMHLHHYCGGVFAEFKAKETVGQSSQAGWLAEIIKQMKYVSGPCNTPKCRLYPELHTRWGWALAEQGNAGDAVREYQLSIKGNPKYTLAYARLSDLYSTLKQYDNARRVLEEGLRANPTSKLLQHRIQALPEINENSHTGSR